VEILFRIALMGEVRSVHDFLIVLKTIRHALEADSSACHTETIKKRGRRKKGLQTARILWCARRCDT